MKNQYPPQTSQTEKSSFFIWKVLPRLVLLAIFAIIVLLVVMISAKKEAITEANANTPPPEKAPINTVVFPLHPTTIRDRINLPGSIEPWTRLNLMAKVRGTVTELFVTEGDEVQKGDPLAKIEENDYEIALERAKAAYKLAQSDFARDQSLFQKGVIPQSQFDAKETNMITAKADMDNAALQLSRCTIKAPIDGVVRTLQAEVGLLLSVGDPVAEILKIDRVKASIGIPESDVAAVRNIDTIEITIKALENKKILAKTHFLNPSPTTTARLYAMELAVDNPAREILPGMFVRAEVVKHAVENSIAIPFYAVITRNDEQYVYIEEDGIAEKRPVTLGIMENWMVEVKSGLKENDRLIIEGQRDIEDGQKIKVVKEINDLSEYKL